MVGRPAPLSARERGSSPAVGPTSILCTLDTLMLRSVSPLKIGGPGLWEAPQGLPDWVPPSLREPVFWSRKRGSALSVGHFSPFPSEARQLLRFGRKLKVVGGFRRALRRFFGLHRAPAASSGPLCRGARDFGGHLLSWPSHARYKVS
ncbi:hypothetical protein NDU88_003601 [Pleurodeles waltl]|uniref:Uncharacterized protein n=1 Tax=Pleurodeles waltl TaxID=8319 RepID=A0AAV7T743_PLEWA|nr:hypothetical protein NDU88_003601 [Pleurodeles waltl]